MKEIANTTCILNGASVHAEAAKKGWVRVMSNQKEGEYEIYDPDKPETLGEVDWSKYPPFQEVDSTTQCIIE